MNIYLAIDRSPRMFLSESSATAFDFLCNFVDALDKIECHVTLLSLDGNPKVIKEKINSAKEIHSLELFSKPDNIDVSPPDFTALCDLIMARQRKLTNYELVCVVEASSYFKINLHKNLRLACAVYFVGVAAVTCSAALMSEFTKISRECAVEAGLLAADVVAIKSDDSDESKDQFDALEVSANNAIAAHATAVALAKRKRSENDVILQLTATHFIEVNVTPGLPNRPFAIFDQNLLCKERIPHRDPNVDEEHAKPITLHLLGFIKMAEFFPYLHNMPMIHGVKPKESSPPNNENSSLFHIIAQALGAETQLAIFQHPNGEQCFLRGMRSASTDPFKLSLQFFASNNFCFVSGSETAKVSGVQLGPVGAMEKPKTELNDISYMPSTVRSYWTDSHGVQSDISKISRHLKRTDRIDQFYQEIQRVSLYAAACGYDYAEGFAYMLEKKCLNIPSENRVHLNRVCEALRNGGFRALMNQPLNAQ